MTAAVTCERFQRGAVEVDGGFENSGTEPMQNPIIWHCSQCSFKVGSRNFALPQYFGQKPRTDGFTGVHMHNCLPPIRVPEYVVTTSDAMDFEAKFVKSAYQLFAGHRRHRTHAVTVTRSTPTNSNSG